MAKTFYIIDAHAQMFRAYYARMQPLTSPTGEPTKATHVFLQFLHKLIKEKRPDYLAVAMDTSDETLERRVLYPDYKAHRDPAPEDFHVQADRIVSIIEAIGIPIFRVPGFEADDLMATLVAHADGEDVDVFLVSKDKDLEQLLKERVHLYDPGKDEVLDAARLLETKGYRPDQVIDVQTLSGDTVDNVPGVKGVGAKTAAKLISQYGSAQAVVEHADELTPKMRENVLAFVPQMHVSRKLVTLLPDVPFPFDLEQCRFGGFNLQKLLPIFNELGMTRMPEQWKLLEESYGSNESSESTLRGAATTAPTDAVLAERDLTLDYRLVDSEKALKELAGVLVKEPAFAFDTETTGLNPVSADLVGISFSWQAGTGYYVPVRGLGRPTLDLDKVVAALAPALASNTALKVGQNIKYDLNALRQAGLRVKGPFFDTMIAAFLLDPLRRSHGLDALVLDYLGHRMIPITDLIGKGRSQLCLDEVDVSRVCEYACEDADYTWRLKEYLEPRIQADASFDLFQHTEMPLMEVLAEMEFTGVGLDSELLRQLSEDFEGRLATLAKGIYDLAGYEFNIDSTRQLGRVLFDEQGLNVVKKTKTGRSTDAETLESLARTTSHPMPKLIMEYRELKKLKSTYVDTLPTMVCRRTGRIHTGFSQTGAVTGRLASSDPNLQNIPIRTEEGRRIRGAFVASDSEHVILVADYSQIELRILAHFCGDRALRKAFEEDADIHAAVAAQVNGVPMEAVTREQRSAAKAVNFGIIYGQSAFGLARSLNISRTEADVFIKMYFMRYPGIRSFIDRCIEEGARDGYVATILGRRRPVPELKSRNGQTRSFGERIAVNTVIQGSAADLIKRAMIDIHEAIQSGGFQSGMLIQVHDELVFESPKDHLEAEAEMIRQKMCHAIELDVPIKVDVGWGPNWLDAK